MGSIVDMSAGRFEGVLNLTRAQIAGHLLLRGAKLSADAPLQADGLQCKGSLVLDDGFVQQHVLTGIAPSGARLDVPAMMRVWVEDGCVTRIDEYLDPADLAPLLKPLLNQAP